MKQMWGGCSVEYVKDKQDSRKAELKCANSYSGKKGGR